MPEANDSPVCPLCGHDGQKEITTRPAQFPLIDPEPPVLTLYKCRECGTIFAEPTGATDPFAVLHEVC